MRYYQEVQKKAVQLDRLHEFLMAEGLSEVVKTEGIELILYNEKIVIEFSDLKGLKIARSIIKKHYPDWTDGIVSVWNSFGKKISTSWQCEEYPFIELWLLCEVTAYPKSLMKPGCRFVSRTAQERLVMVCDN